MTASRARGRNWVDGRLTSQVASPFLSKRLLLHVSAVASADVMYLIILLRHIAESVASCVFCFLYIADI